MKKVSILLLTIDRLDLTREYVGKALEKAGYPFDLLHTDNGSKKEPEVIDLVKSWNPKVQILNDHNGGTAQSLNRMIELNPSDYYVFIGNDIKLPTDWLKKLVEHGEAIPDSGVVGIDWMNKKYPVEDFNGKPVWANPSIFGTMFISKAVRDKVGKFCEDYGVYGLWDSDYNLRVRESGFRNYYLKDMHSEHMGDDVFSKSEYRKMKDESLERAKVVFADNVKRYGETNNFYIG